MNERIALALLALLPVACAGPRVVFHERSLYADIYVVEQHRERSLRFGSPTGDAQSLLNLDDPAQVPMSCLRFAAMGLAFAPSIKRLAVIGLGGGGFSMLLRRALPDAEIDAVEIDPVVVRVAREHFGLREDAQLRVHVGDGATFLQQSTVPYDLIFLDAYNAHDIPEHLRTQAFFQMVRGKLTPTGVVIANVGLPRDDELRVLATLGEVFGELSCARAPDYPNLLTLGSPAPLTGSAEVAARARQLDLGRRLPFSLDEVVAHLGNGPFPPCRREGLPTEEQDRYAAELTERLRGLEQSVASAQRGAQVKQAVERARAQVEGFRQAPAQARPELKASAELSLMEAANLIAGP